MAYNSNFGSAKNGARTNPFMLWTLFLQIYSGCSRQEVIKGYDVCKGVPETKLVVDLRKNGVGYVRSNGRYGYFRGAINEISNPMDSIILYAMPDLIGPRKFHFNNDEIKMINQFSSTILANGMKRAYCSFGDLHMVPFEKYDK